MAGSPSLAAKWIGYSFSCGRPCDSAGMNPDNWTLGRGGVASFLHSSPVDEEVMVSRSSYSQGQPINAG